jgi:hypothetical protein
MSGVEINVDGRLGAKILIQLYVLEHRANVAGPLVFEEPPFGSPIPPETDLRRIGSGFYVEVQVDPFTSPCDS